MRTLLALLLAVAVSGCADDGVTRVDSTVPLIVGQEVEVGVGESIDFSMHTHCGVERAQFNGRDWNVVEPLYASSEKHSPPDGWGNPYQHGRLTLESPTRAVFEAVGEEVVLVPSKTGETPPLCG